MRVAMAAAALLGAFGLAGCLSSSGEVPAWFAERSVAADAGYPSLRDVPRTNTANTDADHWAQVQADLLAAGQEVKENPRSQPASEAEDPNAFLSEAQSELDQARRAHEPN